MQGWTFALHFYNVVEVYKVHNTKKQQCKCGRWHYGLQCLQYKVQKYEEWTLALQNYAVTRVSQSAVQQYNQSWALALHADGVYKSYKTYTTIITSI